MSYDFDAEGFGPDCNPNTPPPFDTSQGGATPRRRGRAGRGQRIEVRARAGGGGGSVTVSADPEAGAQ